MTETRVVTIQCLVYNHEPYLRQCLDGFVMQKTNFPYEAIVHDDCSTDQSAAIIREYAEKYPNIIKPIYESENQYSKKDGRLIEIMNEHTRGRYVAFCEGDDYWTDPYKLQKQVDILEKNKNVMLVYTDYETIDYAGNKIIRPYYEKLKKESTSGDLLPKLILKNYPLTLTTCYRREVLLSKLYQDCELKYDYTTTLTAAMLGDLYYLPESTGKYRMTPNGMIVSRKEELNKDLRRILRYFIEAILHGQGRKRDLWTTLHIRFNIIRAMLYEKTTLSDLLKKHSSLRLLLPPVVINECVYRIKHKLFSVF